MSSVTSPVIGEPPPHQSTGLGGSGRSGVADRLFRGASLGSGVLVTALVTLIGVFLVAQALPALRQDKASFLTSREFSIDGSPLRFGVADLLWATIATSVIAVVIAVPLGMAIALFLTHYAPRRLARPGAELVSLLAAVPSIIYGLWASQLVSPYWTPVQTFLSDHLGFIPLLKDAGISGGATLFFAGIVLAIMILPIITSLSREVFAQTPVTHVEGALALGATRWEMIRTAVLPFGRPGVISAAMLGLGRALGETIAITIIVSTLSPASRIAFSYSLFNGGETFASRIANNAQEFDNPTKAGAYISAGLVLFVLTFVVNAIARTVIERRKAFTE
jgi:phosphate transport system permease protein